MPTKLDEILPSAKAFAEKLALAEAEGCELVTADDQFARRLRPSFPFIISLASLP